VTLNNYGGTCGFEFPSWAHALQGREHGARPANRALYRYKEMQSFQDSASRPYIHLVDGGLADNLGLRSVLEELLLEPMFEVPSSAGVWRIDEEAVRTNRVARSTREAA